MLCCRGTRTCKRSTARCFSCCCRRRATEAPRQIQDHGVSRALDPDSESEAEVVSDPCEAVLVGLELQGKPRALAPEGCEDRAASEPTRLLESDLQLSDLSGKECARLCNHQQPALHALLPGEEVQCCLSLLQGSWCSQRHSSLQETSFRNRAGPKPISAPQEHRTETRGAPPPFYP